MKLKQYYNTAKIPGLPDTTNISDPQLRLFLDRIKVFCSEIALTVDGFQRYSNIENIAKDLVENNFFNEAIGKTITQKVDPIVDDKIKSSVDKINNSDIKLQNIGVNPRVLTINTFIEETAYLVEEYIPSDTENKYKGIYWSSSDENVATVDQSGVVTAVAVGECEIVLTSKYDSDISTVAKVKITNYQTVTVYADISWCTGDHSSVVFTEDAVPGNGACIWENRENIVTLHPDMSEKEAELLAALTSVASTETRKFITCDNHTGTFWRDNSRDIYVSHEPVVVYGWIILGATPSYYSDEQEKYVEATYWTVRHNPNAGETSGRVFSKAYNSGDVSAETAMEYDAAKSLVAEDIPVVKTEDTGIRFAIKAYNKDWTWKEDGKNYLPYSPYGYCVKTGNSIALPNFAPDNRHDNEHQTTTTIYEYETYDGKYTFWSSDNVSGKDNGAYIQKPEWRDIAEMGGWCIYPFDRSVRTTTHIHEACMEINGLLHQPITGTTTHPDRYDYVFDVDYHHAWSLSPCYQDDDKLITVYTEEATPNVGEGYILESKASQALFDDGLVTAVGEGTYSITGANGTTYYPHE